MKTLLNCVLRTVGIRLFSLGFVALFILPLQELKAVSDLPDGLYHMDFSSSDLNQIQSLFPEEYNGVHPSFIHTDTDPNLRLIDTAEISVTFIDEGAGYKNKFGYFLFDENRNVLHKNTLFENASKLGGGGLLIAGDTIDIGTFEAGTNIGFWLQANGYNNPNGATYYTLDELNPDGLRHMAIMSDEENERLVIGIEDLYNLGDQDYNDIIFTFSATPFSALDRSNVPTGAPAPGLLTTSLICGTILGFGWRRRRRTSANNH